MKACKHPGKCSICGQLKELTFEHVPPQNAFNSQPVLYYSFDEVKKTLIGEDGRMPWNFEGLKGRIQQRGSGGYYLCRECNNNTGSWYVREYTDFVKTIGFMIQQENVPVNTVSSFQIKSCYPLRLFKTIITMFCDINIGLSKNDKIREFILNRESKEFDTSKYEVYMYLIDPSAKRISPISGMCRMETEFQSALISEISSYPIGLILYIDRPKSFEPFGIKITDWCNFDYDFNGKVIFENIPYVRMNSQFPGDFRTQQEIQDNAT